MAEPLCSAPLVAIAETDPLRQIGLRLRPPFPADLGGLPLPLTPNRVAVMGSVRTLWLGPDEWLVTAETTRGSSPVM